MKEYIDREAIIKLSKQIKDNFAPLHRKVIDAFIYNIDKNIPSADVAPVVHGKWLDEDSFDAHGSPIYRCSECNKTVADNYISCHKYCLHCGAKMDEAKQEKLFPRCNKCVYEITCSKNMDNENKCPDYKRDPPDGGYYG